MDKPVASIGQNMSLNGTPIFKLNDRLLTLIFMINTEHKNRFTVTPNYPLSDYQPLSTTRHTSQVCWDWRNLILKSPIIWGSIIDLDLLHQKKDHWRNEVLKRSESATLCISGTVEWRKSKPRSFFTTLLTECWKQIQKLDVELRNPYANLTPPVIQGLRSRHAPNLQFISICIPIPLTSETIDYPDKLCGGRRPEGGNLRIFCPTMPKHLSAPWLPQLREITISWVQDARLFPLLSKMDLLETLRIEPPTKLNKDFIPKKPIALPNLTFIDLRNHFHSCSLILKRITPSPHCILQLTSYNMEPNFISGRHDLALFTQVLGQYSTAYFSTGNITHLKIYFSDNHISVNASAGGATTAQLFDFQVHPMRKLPFIIPSSLLSCISSAQLSSITTFEFQLFECQKCQLLHDDFMELISACPLVCVIQVTKKAIEVLHDLTQEQPMLLPSLEVLSLQMNDSEKLYPPCMDYLDAILAFLVLRREANLPVNILDLTACNIDKLENLEYWDECLGVKIRRREKLCILKKEYGNTREKCSGCGIACILDPKNGLKIELGMQVGNILVNSANSSLIEQIITRHLKVVGTTTVKKMVQVIGI